MGTITVLQIQAGVEATLVITSLLLVSAVIGYATAWFYSRFIHRRNIKIIEAESERLSQQVVVKNNETINLQKKLAEMNSQFEMQSKDFEKLKTQYAAHISARELNEMDDLKMISGIGPFIEERLHEMNINSFDQISHFDQKDVKRMNTAIEYFAGRIERDNWIAQATELVNEEEREEALDRIRARKTRIYFNRIGMASKHQADELTEITGIGGWIEKKLNAVDIYTFKQIANFNKEDIELVTETIEYFPGRIERDEWVHQAKELVRVEGKKADLLKKTVKKRDIISTNGSGEVLKHQANNLTLIKGINLWIEERLNVLGIFTFGQIAKLSPDDIKTIAEILEVSPGRIQEDNWIAQAKEFTNKKVAHAV